MQEQQVR